MDVIAQSVCLRCSLPEPVLDGSPAVRITLPDVDRTVRRQRHSHTEEAHCIASAVMLLSFVSDPDHHRVSQPYHQPCEFRDASSDFRRRQSD